MHTKHKMIWIMLVMNVALSFVILDREISYGRQDSL